MKIVSLILGCLHIPVGALVMLGSLLALSQGRSTQPFWLVARIGGRMGLRFER